MTLLLPLFMAREAAAQSETKKATPPADHPLAGYRAGGFFLRDEKDLFILYPSLDLQIDHYNYFGPGVGDTNLKSTFAFRRTRLTFAGEFLKDWTFRLELEMGRTALDNLNGRDETSAAAPGAAPTATSGQYAPAQTARVVAQLVGAWVGYRVHPALNFRVGQALTSFSMENSTPPRSLQFMEKSLATRVLGSQVANGVDLHGLLWGTLGEDIVTYTVAFVNGAGPNRLDTDGRGDLMTRVYVRPLSTVSGIGELKGLHFGGSFSYGSRDPTWTHYDYNAMTTQGNYAFWRPNYRNSLIGRNVHVVPANNQIAAAGELRVPFSIFDLMAEVVYVDNGTREVVEGYQSQNPAYGPGTLGFGHMHGFGYYLHGGVWLFGPRTGGRIGETFKPARLNLSKPDSPHESSLQAMVRWEQVSLRYDGYSKTSAVTATGAPAFTGVGPYDGDIKVNAISGGLNYWATRHIRLTAQWTTYLFPDSAPPTPTHPGGPVCDAVACANRAQAPAQSLPGTPSNVPQSQLEARDNGHSLHELLFRAQVTF
ncbi:OprO/OprP family phosphate-selective porin [Pendulispora rubella]|uniref:OprO/OprP family phosphate-selective porin n=1 Tax=Pendulispora rubella TaxID=2741070 RepID=A0ABZ2L1J7_9BACT